MRKINFILILILTLLACNRQKEIITEISGVLKDYYSNEIIKGEGIELKLTQGIDPMRYSDRYKNPILKDIIVVDPDGYFNSTYIDNNEGELSSSYGLFGLFIYNDSLISYVYAINEGEYNSIEMRTFPIRILNISVFDTSSQYDLIKINCHTEYTDLREDFIYEIENKDTFVNYKVVPEWNHTITWSLYRNGEYKYGNQEYIDVENIDTIFYEIYF